MPFRFADVEPILIVNTAAVTQEGFGGPYDLVSLAAVKAELEITATTWDTLLASWITSASHRIMNYTNRVFAVETVTETWRFPLWRHPSPYLPQSEEIIVNRFPVQSFISVQEFGSGYAQPPCVLVENTDFESDHQTGQVWRLDQLGNRIHWNVQLVTVNYIGGYEPTDGRLADAQLACMLLVKARSAEQGVRDPNLVRENIPGVVDRQWYIPAAKSSGMPPEVQDMLDSYCDVLV